MRRFSNALGYDDHVTSRSVQQIERLRKLRSRPGGELSIAGMVNATANDAKRTHKKLGELIELWQELVPPQYACHTSLVGLRGGVLQVAVDSSSIGYEIDRLLRNGLMNELRSRYKGTLIRIKTRIEGKIDDPPRRGRAPKSRSQR